MITKRGLIYVISFIFVSVFILSYSSAWEINGTVKDINGNYLNNTNVSVSIQYISGTGPPLTIGINSTTTNASGWFSLNVYDNNSCLYKINLKHKNSTTDAVDYVGQNLPFFPYLELSTGISSNFYLKDAGTINITVINESGVRVAFNYEIRDTQLGYNIENVFTQTGVNESTVYVPRDKNYTIMVYPINSMPISYKWTNFTSSTSYVFSDSLSRYNTTTKTLHKQFNDTLSLIRITGYLNGSSSGISGWNEFRIIPFLLEGGDRVFIEYGTLPYNMSAWNVEGGGPQSDVYNYATGYFNISLPGPAESQEILLFASAKNNSNWYGGYKNITIEYAGSGKQYNMTLYGFLGNQSKNISTNNANDGSQFNITTKQLEFKLVNSTSNNTLSLQTEGHMEVKVDYTNYGAIPFTFMGRVSSNTGYFFLPLINATGIKEINAFTQGFAPRSIDSKSAQYLMQNSNISMNTFNPKTIGGTSGSSISIVVYNSNSSCDLPGQESGCSITSANMASFNPLSAIIGGGKISFRMGINSVLVHYVNVDMLASGPPDALFESNDDVTESVGSTNFRKLMRFGSGGPKIYDYALISIPYTPGTSTTAGLNESASVYMKIANLYDENWNIIWNATLNGTSGTALGANFSHYYDKRTEWSTLLGDNTCVTNVASFGSSNPCYLDAANNRVWIRIPHFSGTSPLVRGSVTNTTSVSGSDTTGAGTLSNTNITSETFWISTYTQDDKDFSLKKSIEFNLVPRERIRIKVNGSIHYIGYVSGVVRDYVTINVSSNPQQSNIKVGESARFELTNDNYYDIKIKLISLNTSRAYINISSIYEEKVVLYDQVNNSVGNNVVNNASPITNTTTNSTSAAGSSRSGRMKFTFIKNPWFWITVIVIILAIVGLGIYLKVRGIIFKNKIDDKVVKKILLKKRI